MSAQKKSKARRLTVGFCKFLGGLLIVALVGEFYLKSLGGSLHDCPLDDAELFFVPTPGSWTSEEDPDVKENVGPDGMRLSRPDGTVSKPHNVLVSGCSYTFGVGVADKETYVWRLNELCPEANFDNCGVSGYGPYRSLIRLRRYLPRKRYDLVIYSMLDNHLDRDSMPHLVFTNDGDSGELITLPYMSIDGSGNCVEHPLQQLNWPLTDRSYLMNFLRNSCVLVKARSVQEPSVKEKQAIFAYIMNSMATEARAANAKFVLAVLNRNPVPAPMFSPDVNIINVAFQNGEDLSDEYRVRHQHNTHPNGIVHDYWASKIAEQLREQHYLD